jgi:hypothetical protein
MYYFLSRSETDCIKAIPYKSLAYSVVLQAKTLQFIMMICQKL